MINMSAEIEEIFNPFNELRELFEEEFLNNEKIRYGFGILIPIDHFKNGNLCDFVHNIDGFEEYYITNPKLGPLLSSIKQDLKISVRTFSQIVGKRYENTFHVFRNKDSITVLKLLKLPYHPIIKKSLNFDKLNHLKEVISRLITSNSSKITRKGSKFNFSFNPKSLQDIKIGIREYFIIPRSRWEIKREMEKLKTWALGFYFITSLFGIFSGNRGRSPMRKELIKKFGGGIYRNLDPYGIAHNILLKCWEIPENITFKYNWNDPSIWSEVKDWAQKFYLFSSIFGLILRKRGRSPKMKELDSKFGGFTSVIKKRGKTYNDMLRVWNLPYNIIYKFDWNKESSWKIAKTWARGFFTATYIFNPITKENIRAPKYIEMAVHFGGGYKSYLTRNKIFHNKLMKSWNITVLDIKSRAKEGVIFDKIGKECLSIISEEVLRGVHVIHPELKKFNKKWVVPDGIIHNLDKFPLKIKNKTIYLQSNQKLDKIIDFKRDFGSMAQKDWDQYTRIAKRFDIYLLHGNSKIYNINGCKIIFYSRNDLISLLKEKSNEGNENKINSLIKQIINLRRGILDSSQKKLEKYTFN